MNWKSILTSILLFLSTCASMPEPAQRPIDAPQVYRDLSSEQLFARGVVLANSGQLIRAEQYLYLAAQRGYPEEKTLPLLIKICLSTSRLRTALNYTQPYLTRHPESWMLRYLVASILLALEQPMLAHNELARVVRDNPTHAPAYYLLAVISRDALHDDASAQRHFAAYLQHQPNGTHADEASAWLREHPIDSRRSMHRKVGRALH